MSFRRSCCTDKGRGASIRGFSSVPSICSIIILISMFAQSLPNRYFAKMRFIYLIMEAKLGNTWCLRTVKHHTLLIWVLEAFMLQTPQT